MRSHRRRILPILPAASGWPACWTRSKSPARVTSAIRKLAHRKDAPVCEGHAWRPGPRRQREPEKGHHGPLAEALLPEQAELDRRDAQAIEEGRKLLVDPQGVFGCTNCHSFHGQGARGSAPILTGYGSPLWTAGIVRDPTDKQYYGRLNDRMPSFAPLPLADSPRNTLSLLQIRLLTDWLRGDWWEPSSAARR